MTSLNSDEETSGEGVPPSSLLLGIPPSEILTQTEEENFDRKIEKCKIELEELNKGKGKGINNSKTNSNTNTQSIFDFFSKKIKEKLEKYINKFKSAKVIRTFDKFMFVLGLSRLVYEAYILGRSPCSYPAYYSIVVFILVFLRFFYYRWLHWHYFLLDFCYWANLTTVAFFYIFPDNEFLFISNYAFSFGPLLLAVPIFKNSMVIHSIDKLTSVFIHLAPGLAMWAVRSNSCEAWPITTITPTLFKYILYTGISYLTWALIYYLVIFIFAFKRCEKKNNLTMFAYHLENKNGFFYKLTGIFGEKIRPFAFMSVHMIFSLLTLFITYFTLYSQILQLIFLIFTTMQTFWTAGNYYMEIFSKNYEIKLQELEKLRASVGGAEDEIKLSDKKEKEKDK